MTTQIQRRRGTTAQHGTFTGANGEITIDTDKEVVVVHDGAQVGGYPAMRENGSNSALALGSAATPSLKFTGDPNTGLYSPGSDQLALATGGTGRLFVDSNGKVGIGTATAADDAVLTVTKGANIAYPGQNNAQLHINNSTGPAGILIASSTVNNIFFADAAANNVGRIYYDHSSDFLAVHTNSSERMRLDSSGRLGLGTSVPPALFSAHSTDTSADFFIGEFQSTANPTGLSNTYVKFEKGDGFGGAVGGFIEQGVGSGLKLAALNSGTLTDVVTIRHTGQVGIGTTAPSSLLHVEGGTTYINSTNAGGTSTALQLSNGGSSGTCIVKLAFNNSQFTKSSINAAVLGNDFLAFNVGSDTERARIDSSGRLLVGTSTSLNTKYSASSFQPGLQSAATAGTVGFYRFSNNADGPALVLSKSRSDTLGTQTIVSNGDTIGYLGFTGSDGTEFQTGATIFAQVDGIPGANDMPGRLVFSVTADGASSPTEALRISNNRAITVSDGGNVVLGTTTGTKIGTATTQKLGFYNATPVVQPAAVADATTAVDVITQLNDLLAKLRTLGIIAT